MNQLTEAQSQLIKDITKLVWNDYLATPKNEHREMEFSYQGLKNSIGVIVIEYLTTHEDQKQLIENECVIHPTDYFGKCFKCLKQVFTRERV
jgi:hypothetical protein